MLILESNWGGGSARYCMGLDMPGPRILAPKEYRESFPARGIVSEPRFSIQELTANNTGRLGEMQRSHFFSLEPRGLV
jgi:hypothetical protein